MEKLISKKIPPFLPLLFLIFLVVDLYMIFFYAPEELTQGLAQKIFYFHVPSAFAMYIGFLASGLGAVMFLMKKNPAWNALSHAGASVGLVFCSMVLVSGPIWAKPIWGAWWTWDPRLTTTLILWLIFFATLLLRNFYGPDTRGRVYASILTLFGVVDIPIIVFAVKLWRGIHPSVLGKKDNMPIEMKATLFVSIFTVLVFVCILLWLKTRFNLLEDKLHRLSIQLEEGN